MRYSIFEYSQEKLVSLNLDVVDALLLNWFANFFCGKMEKKIFKDADGNPKIYGWVKISKILEDLPVVGITSEKGIRVRFDSFVEKGILARETINTQKGKKSYYRTTSVYDSLINTVALEKTQETTSEKQKEATESLQRNCSSLAEKSAKENQEKISHESIFTFAETQSTESSENNPQRNCSSLAERNKNTFAQRNCSSHALNNSLVNDSLNINSSTTDNYKQNSEEDFLIQKINQLFDNSITFSQDLSQKLSTSLQQSQIPESEYEHYILWAFDYLKQRNEKPENFPGYFYKSISESALIYKFRIFIDEQIKKEKQKAAEEIVCPICDDKHNQYIPCPVCQNYYFDLISLSAADISRLKKIFNMPQEIKNDYENEINTIYQKYPFFEVVRNTELKKQMENSIFEIDKKYGVIEEAI